MQVLLPFTAHRSLELAERLLTDLNWRLSGTQSDFGAVACIETDCGCADGVAVYKDIPFMTSSGPVTSTLQNARVS